MKCYVCGAAIGETFTLVAYSAETDRVFVMDGDCALRVDDGPEVIQRVRRVAS